jgi:hypothetical protein
LTSGSVLFSNGTTIAQDNANLFFDDTNNRLGIGSAAPVSRLSVVDSTSTVASLTANAASHFNISRGVSGVTNLVFTISGVSPNTAAIQHRHSNIDGIGYPIAINPLGGNVQIGTTTDAGYKLDVNGTVRSVGQNYYGTFSESPLIYGSDAAGVYAASSASLAFALRNGGGGSGRFIFTSPAKGATSLSTQYLTQLIATFNPTSGVSSYTMLELTPTINQTGGANGITRGLHIAPTLTAAFDFRAIEVASGITILGAATTAKASLRIPSGTAPTSPVNGDIWFDGTDIKMRIGGVTKTFTLI